MSGKLSFYDWKNHVILIRKTCRNPGSMCLLPDYFWLILFFWMLFMRVQNRSSVQSDFQSTISLSRMQWSYLLFTCEWNSPNLYSGKLGNDVLLHVCATSQWVCLRVLGICKSNIYSILVIEALSIIPLDDYVSSTTSFLLMPEMTYYQILSH